MDQRIVEFVTALRSQGVRVSLAETADAVRAISAVGMLDREMFKSALKATLIKEPADVKSFDQAFPLYFGHEGDPLQSPEGLTKEQQEQLQNAIDELREQIKQLMQMLAQGQQPSKEQMEQFAKQAGLNMQRMQSANPEVREWLTERMLRQMGLTPEQVRDALEALMKQLKQQGMSSQGRQEVRDTVQQNAEAMREQVGRFVGQSLLQKPEDYQHRQKMDDLMDRPLASLSEAETDELRGHVRRLVARLRSRAALRQRRGGQGNFDVKGTIRFNQRNMGVPMEIKYRKRHLKPKICVIVDVSTSMRPVADFMLRMMYEMQDQVSKANSFAFISDIRDVSMMFTEHRPENAVPLVLNLLPPGHYSTDLGNSMATFVRDHMGTIDRRTTLIFVGDARNNFNDPRLDIMQLLKLRTRRVVWFNPEPPYHWGSGDSDMPAYVPFSDAVHQVATLRQLADAIDDIFQKKQ